MTAIKIFNVCTHCKGGGDGTLGTPTPAVVAAHPTHPHRFATGGGDANVFIWQLCTEYECGLDQLAKLTYHTESINCVVWSSTGDQLASAGDDKMIAIWKQDGNYDHTYERPAFGENMVFREKWTTQCKIRGPLAEVSDMLWLQNGKHVVVSTLDGRVTFYSLKKQESVLSIALHAQFIQGISLDVSNTLLAVQPQSTSGKVYRIIKKHPKKEKKHAKNGNANSKFDSTTFASLSYFPANRHEQSLQKQYDADYKQKLQAMKEAAAAAAAAAQSENKMEVEVAGVKPAAPKLKKKKVSKCALFKQNLLTTARKPHWSPDGVLLCMVAGQSKDKKHDCVHVFHRSNLSKNMTTFLLPQSSAATMVRFCPLKLKVEEDQDAKNGGVHKGSIVHKYGMKYRLLFAVICLSEVFVFDTSKNNAILYWKDTDTNGLHDLQWAADGKSLFVADVEGFIAHIAFSDQDLVVAIAK